MSLLPTMVGGLRSLFRKKRVEKELDDELRGFFDMAAEEKMNQGMCREEALRSARLERGSLEVSREVVRTAGWESFVETCWQDLRFAVRILRKSPGFTSVAILTLALGIGANTAIFSLVNGVLLRPLPYRNPNRLTMVWEKSRDGSPENVGYATYLDWESQNKSFEEIAIYSSWQPVLQVGEPEQFSGLRVTSNYFRTLGIHPEIGRDFLPEEDVPNANKVVMLSHSLWQRKFNSDPNIIGHSINLEGVARQIVGVMPRDFRFPSPQSDVWIPLDMDSRNTSTYWAGDFMPVIGRLRPGATTQQADAEIRLLQSQLPPLFPWPMPNSWNASVSAVSLQTGLASDVRTRLLILLVAVALVLLIACANVANLTLSRVSVPTRT